MREIDEYDLGYFEGVREVAQLYNRCLMKMVNSDMDIIELQLDSEAFVTELASLLQDAHELRYRNES